jgi:hypothetical protein
MADRKKTATFRWYGEAETTNRRDAAMPFKHPSDADDDEVRQMREILEATDKISKREYRTRIDYFAREDGIFKLRFEGRTPKGEGYPEEVKEALYDLQDVLMAGGCRAENKNEERIAAENALTFLRNALDVFEKYEIPVPKMLTQLQIDLVRVRNELDPTQSQDRPR